MISFVWAVSFLSISPIQNLMFCSTSFETTWPGWTTLSRNCLKYVLFRSASFWSCGRVAATTISSREGASVVVAAAAPAACCASSGMLLALLLGLDAHLFREGHRLFGVPQDV